MTLVALGEDGKVPVEEPAVGGASFASFYGANHARLVRALAAAIGDDDLAADAVDEAFARAYGRWDVVSSGPNPEGWVFRTALNWSMSRFRRLASRRRYGHRVAQPREGRDQYTYPDMNSALDRLPVDQRTVVAMRYLLDWDVATTARALDIAEGTVRSRTSRAIHALRAATELEE